MLPPTGRIATWQIRTRVRFHGDKVAEQWDIVDVDNLISPAHLNEAQIQLRRPGKQLRWCPRGDLNLTYMAPIALATEFALGESR